MGLSWNSWYNPLDNVAAIGKTFGTTFGSTNISPSTAGKSITNLGSSVPSTVTNQAKTTAQAAPASAAPAQNDGSNTTNTTVAYDPAAAAAAAQRQANIDFVNRSFDVKLAGLQGQLDTLPAQQNAANLQLQNQYQTSANKLDTSRAQGLRNLDTSRNQIADSRTRGLKSIADQLRQQGMSYANQLGAYGAGDSSAAQLINFALSGQASRNRGDLVRNASDQATAVDTQQADLETAYKQNMDDLTNWKQTQLADLAAKFADIKNNIANEMANANLQRQQQLAQYDAGVTQSAIAQLSNIENMYKQQAAETTQRFQSMFAPSNIQIAPELQQYAVQPINAGQLQGLSMPTQSNVDPGTTAILKKLDEQQNPLGL